MCVVHTALHLGQGIVILPRRRAASHVVPSDREEVPRYVVLGVEPPCLPTTWRGECASQHAHGASRQALKGVSLSLSPLSSWRETRATCHMRRALYQLVDLEESMILRGGLEKPHGCCDRIEVPTTPPRVLDGERL